jgi:hypothetical protein
MFRRRLIPVWIVIILFTFLGVSCSGYTVIPLGLSFIIDPAPDPQINNNAYPVLSSHKQEGNGFAIASYKTLPLSKPGRIPVC